VVNSKRSWGRASPVVLARFIWFYSIALVRALCNVRAISALVSQYTTRTCRTRRSAVNTFAFRHRSRFTGQTVSVVWLAVIARRISPASLSLDSLQCHVISSTSSCGYSDKALMHGDPWTTLQPAPLTIASCQCYWPPARTVLGTSCRTTRRSAKRNQGKPTFRSCYCGIFPRISVLSIDLMEYIRIPYHWVLWV